MLNKCANPSCSTQLVYLREGKIFVMERAPQSQPPEMAGPEKKAMPAGVEHFWLCGPCSAEMTLIYDRAAGVRVTRKARKQERAAC